MGRTVLAVMVLVSMALIAGLYVAENTNTATKGVSTPTPKTATIPVSVYDGYKVYLLRAEVVSLGGPRVLVLQLCTENPHHDVLSAEVYVDGVKLPKNIVIPVLFREERFKGMRVVNCSDVYTIIAKTKDGSYIGGTVLKTTPERAYRIVVGGKQDELVDFDAKTVVIKPFVYVNGTRVYMPELKIRVRG